MTESTRGPRNATIPLRPTALAVLGAAFAAGCGTEDPDAPEVSAETLALTRLPTTSWPTNGGDLYNRRYSPLTGIDRDNVARLKGVWRARLGGSGVGPQYSGEAQPIVDDGVIYIVTGANDVFALDVDTGEILWDYRANLDRRTTLSAAAGRAAASGSAR